MPKKVLTLFIFCMVSALLFFEAFYVAYNHEKMSSRGNSGVSTDSIVIPLFQATPVPTPTPYPTMIPRIVKTTQGVLALGPISSWKDYTFTAANMRMKIPQQSETLEREQTGTTQVRITTGKKGDEIYSEINIIEQTDSKTTSLREWIEQEAPYRLNKQSTFVDLTIGGKPALRFNVSTQSGYPDSYYLMNGKKVFAVAENGSTQYVGNRDAILKGVLSTLEYLH